MIRSMDVVAIRSLPGVADFERRYAEWHRLMADELAQLDRDMDALSISLFGVTVRDTYWVANDVGALPGTEEEWERQFEFLDEEREEETEFWRAFGLDFDDEEGEWLACYAPFARQAFCAVRGIHPAASLRFAKGAQRTDAQLIAEAEAWAKWLLRDRRPR